MIIPYTIHSLAPLPNIFVETVFPLLREELFHCSPQLLPRWREVRNCRRMAQIQTIPQSLRQLRDFLHHFQMCRKRNPTEMTSQRPYKALNSQTFPNAYLLVDISASQCMSHVVKRKTALRRSRGLLFCELCNSGRYLRTFQWEIFSPRTDVSFQCFANWIILNI